MRIIFITILLVLGTATPAWTQDISVIEAQTERLRAQLRDAAEKEAQLRERARQLDEELRPESIERSVAAVGTTDARALRDQRRQQLERQKAALEEQLNSLATSRARLESAIATAEAEAVRLRAAALGAADANARAQPPAANNTPAPPPAAKRRKLPPRKARPRKANRPRRRSR